MISDKVEGTKLLYAVVVVVVVTVVTVTVEFFFLIETPASGQR